MLWKLCFQKPVLPLYLDPVLTRHNCFMFVLFLFFCTFLLAKIQKQRNCWHCFFLVILYLFLILYCFWRVAPGITLHNNVKYACRAPSDFPNLLTCWLCVCINILCSTFYCFVWNGFIDTVAQCAFLTVKSQTTAF